MKKIVILLLLLGMAFCVTTSVKPKQAQADSGWTWAITTDGNSDIWMTASVNGSAKFSYCLGAGGCIKSVQFVPLSRELLSPPSAACPTSQVDRVIHWTYWGNDLLDPHEGLTDTRFNINQAGASGRLLPSSQYDEDDEIFAPTLRVEVSGNVVDVYSIPQEFFFQVHDGYQAGEIACLTRYEMLDYGVLKVRRIVRVCEATNPGHNPADPYDITLTGWTPYRRSSITFNAATEALNQSTGVPTGTQYVSPYIQEATSRYITGTNGFVVLYQTNHYADMPAVATVFGTQNTTVQSSPGSNPTYLLQRQEWANFGEVGGIGVSLRVKLNDCLPGSIIDQTIYIVASPACGVAMKNLVNWSLSQVPAPVIYGPNHNHTGELATIVAQLEDDLEETITEDMRTPHLGDLVE